MIRSTIVCFYAPVAISTFHLIALLSKQMIRKKIIYIYIYDLYKNKKPISRRLSRDVESSTVIEIALVNMVIECSPWIKRHIYPVYGARSRYQCRPPPDPRSRPQISTCATKARSSRKFTDLKHAPARPFERALHVDKFPLYTSAETRDRRQRRESSHLFARVLVCDTKIDGNGFPRSEDV